MDPKTAAARLSEITVVVVDDEHYMRKVVRTMLSGFGVRNIHEAADGPAGLELIRGVRPDVVIVDWQMPGLDGAGFVRIARSPNSPYPNVPIIMLTGHAEKSRVVEAIKAGVNEFLLKPVSSKALQERLISALVNPRRQVSVEETVSASPSAVSRQLVNLRADQDRSTSKLVYLP